jgi:hypothetical protein
MWVKQFRRNEFYRQKYCACEHAQKLCYLWNSCAEFNNSIQLNSTGFINVQGLTAQVPITKPAQEHKYNTKPYKYTKAKH